jgi:hypothetical protein
MAFITQILDILLYVLITFIGYSIGRIGHIYGGHLKDPHHWIYGLILIIIGIYFYREFWGVFIISLGVGVFISDLKDFFNRRIYGVDNVKKKKFWGID